MTAESTTPGDRAPSRDGLNVAVVHEQLRQAILRGDVPPGPATSQLVLARELGVGRTPLREALRMLQSEGLVISEPNRRVRIAELSVVDAEELYVMRILLEAAAARMTVPTLTDNDIAELEGLMAQMDHLTRTNSPIRDTHHQFHARLVKAAGPRVVSQITQLFDHAERYRAFASRTGTGEPDHHQLRRAEHRQILDAAAAGDAPATAQALAAHYLMTAKLVAGVLDPDYDLARLRVAIALAAPGIAADV
jgi:DNA-binding GntR family transcriptional regulator